MSRNLTTMTRIILGPGHVIEDSTPTPAKFRNTKSNPPKDKPAQEIIPIPIKKSQED
jgi:hypothetical protein